VLDDARAGLNGAWPGRARTGNALRLVRSRAVPSGLVNQRPGRTQRTGARECLTEPDSRLPSGGSPAMTSAPSVCRYPLVHGGSALRTVEHIREVHLVSRVASGLLLASAKTPSTGSVECTTKCLRLAHGTPQTAQPRRLAALVAAVSLVATRVGAAVMLASPARCRAGGPRLRLRPGR
jgi:hypothetical protein